MIYLTCPLIFDIGIDENRAESLKFLADIKQLASAKKVLVLDFSQTQMAYAESTLILFAIVFSICRKYGKNCIKFIYPKQNENRSGYDYFVSTRLNVALEANTEDEITALTTTHNFYQSGASDRFEDMLISIWSDIEREKINPEQKYLLLQGISEAILNVKNHAYINKRALRNLIGKGRWWQCSWYQQSKRRFVFLIYDIGSGILGTYNKGTAERVELLKEAMTEGFTRYTNRKRGKGSENIKKVISNNVENELLTVYTDELIFLYQYENGSESIKCIATDPTYVITGTLVSWTLTLTEDFDNAN